LLGQNALGQALHVSRRAWEEALSDAWRGAGIGAPAGNKNALKHGRYTRETIEQRRQLQALLRRSRDLMHEIK
jgi:hypothetical protein